MTQDQPRPTEPDPLQGGLAEQAPDQADRLAQPVDAENPPRLAFPVVGIGASAGGLEACLEFFRTVPADSRMAFVVVQHLPPDRSSLVAEIIGRSTGLPTAEIEDGMPVEPGRVYVIRPGRALRLHEGRLRFGEPVNRPGMYHPIDEFFRSLAEEQQERAVALVFSGMGSNGSAGAQAIKAVGGLCIAQDPETAKFPSMPRHVIDAGYADYVLRPQQAYATIARYAEHPYARRAGTADPSFPRRDWGAFKEILAVLRARARQDFLGYKKLTIYRRILRRMGLHQLMDLNEYARLVRQSPSEANALADDLVIHVTGFFRDPEAWDTLRTQVIRPLVGRRDEPRSIRAWVTACSSGEEAYSLAMLLHEACEAAGCDTDIKIFATDLAERTLHNARAGIYPAGIEADISPDRLERYFDRESSVFRVKRELRELVVFAPQNVLQDPPFSRLDLVTCRNLLIYLEPETQARLLSLFHFGLREGGALFLGNSETTGGGEHLFEPIDKRHRIYRRIGGPRPPLPPLSAWRREAPEGAGAPSAAARPARLSVAQVTHQVLLDRFTPTAVVVDREQRIVYFHGDSSPYLVAPTGEPTRDLLAQCREGVRGAVRSALHAAMTESRGATVPDGVIDMPEGRRRVVVTAAPLDPHAPPDHYIIAFRHDPEPEPEPPPADASPDHSALVLELRRVQEELQGTVEELQTSNEELRASNEEVTSVNEELQSTNEELETSKEELQSLNEELTTLNAQLQAKMEELEAATNDLASLLSSTSIAVLFLDTNARIRRYTPAMRELVDLIPADVGRPLSDLAPKFSDPHLAGDVRAVLDTLAPVEREIGTAGGGRFVRRVLPYRTADNRIDGVVVTFVNVSHLREAERARRTIEEQCRLIVEGVRDYAIILIGTDGRIMSWNTGAGGVLGYSEPEAVGQHAGLIDTAEDRAAGVFDLELRAAADTGQSGAERWHVRKDGTRFWGSGVLTALRDPDGRLRGFVKILRDNTDRKLFEAHLEDLRRAAEAANEAKDHFLATVSHELRTPLSVILMWSRMLSRGTLRAEQVTEALAAIERSVEVQKKLIDDLLDTARITAGKLRLNVRDFDLARTIGSAVEAIRPAADAKGIHLDIELAADIGLVRADPDRIQQVVWNLLANAVKFTGAGGRVTLSARSAGERVELVVRDNGQGIGVDLLPQVFQPFRQSEAQAARSQGGLGLGLAIVKQLVELHGGSVSAASPGPGLGSTFICMLPIRRATNGHADAPPQPAAGGAARRADLRDTHILIVEDHPETRAALRALLEEAGARVSTVESGRDALLELERHPPDAVVSDLGMPDMDGNALAGAIRDREARAGTGRTPLPLVAVSAFTRTADVDRARSSGFDAFVPKPVELDELVAVLAPLLARRQP